MVLVAPPLVVQHMLEMNKLGAPLEVAHCMFIGGMLGGGSTGVGVIVWGDWEYFYFCAFVAMRWNMSGGLEHQAYDNVLSFYRNTKAEESRINEIKKPVLEQQEFNKSW
eukprot:11344268-Ditylum_brightwellii.AAC.1